MERQLVVFELGNGVFLVLALMQWKVLSRCRRLPACRKLPPLWKESPIYAWYRLTGN